MKRKAHHGPRGHERARTARAPGAMGGVRIVHEDAHIIVIDKPAGMLTANMPGETRESVFDYLKMHARRHRNRGGRVFIVHRLDKESSGLLVFAKTERAFNWLKEDLRAKRVHRLYLALVEGEIGDAAPGAPVSPDRPVKTAQMPSGTIQSFLNEDERGIMRTVELGDVARQGGRTPGPRRMPRAPGPAGPGAPRPAPGADKPESGPQLAVTHWKLVAKGLGRSLLQVRLETGRKNQIRAHMTEWRHPIVGDRRYNAATDPIGRVCLHASELGFAHPGTGHTVRYFSPAPHSFYRMAGIEPPEPAPVAEPVEAQARPAPAEPARQTEGMKRAAGAAGKDEGWDHVAEWYDQLIDEQQSDHYQDVILPGTLRLLQSRPGMKVLDVACGQGVLARRMAEGGVLVAGVDASPKLIEAARGRSAGMEGLRFEVGDARDLGAVAARAGGEFGPFDAATCIMALMNIDPMSPVLSGCAGLLAPGGALVAVILHPAFRSPGQTSWGWTGAHGAGARAGIRRPARSTDTADGGVLQYRRVDGYLSPGQREITMNPGKAAHGGKPVITMTYHRPLQAYFKALADAGFVVEAIEEWPSLRRSRPGPRGAEENRARREIPMFLGFRAIKK